MLESIEIPGDVIDWSIPSEVRAWIHEARRRIEAFQDRWDRPQIEQFVASDYELVFQCFQWIETSGCLRGNRFLEWGCGFSVVCALAARMGWDVVGIEAEEVLLKQGRQTIRDWAQPAELVHGNFLPAGAESLAEDPTLPSLGHPVADVYEQIGLELEDFDLVFAYPWPGEEDFLERVFDRFASPGALLLQFCGPYDMRLWRRKKGH